MKINFISKNKTFKLIKMIVSMIINMKKKIQKKMIVIFKLKNFKTKVNLSEMIIEENYQIKKNRKLIPQNRFYSSNQ